MRRSIRRTLLQGAAAAVLALATLTTVGCGDDEVTTPTTPTTPVTPSVTETFSGELRANGASSYAFIVTTAGTVTVTLSTIDPATTISFGLSLGTWNGAACQTVIANDAALLNTVVTGSVTAATSLCARVYDAGRLVDPLTYTITVVHP